MIRIKKIRIFTYGGMVNKEIYIIVKAGENAVVVTKVEKIKTGVTEWNLQLLVEKQEYSKSMLLELWDYNQLRMIGKHGIKLAVIGQNECSYNGFIGSGQSQVKISVVYEILVSEKQVKADKLKTKQTKRTDSTNRQSNNSLTHVIQQPSSIKQLYKSLIHSISQRHLGQFNPKTLILQNKSAQRIFSPKLGINKNKPII